jgi:type IV secretion system protein VirB10
MAPGEASFGNASGYGAPGDAPAARGVPTDAAPGNGSSANGAPGLTQLATLLKPSVTPAVRAQMLPARRLLLPKGAFVDCTLETAIDSTLPGMTTCVTATDTFGVDGQVVLLERGTKLIGETRGQVQQGAARIFVLWTEARTPADVVVPLDSPGADELGRSGLPGEVERHFWQRFGAAMLVSVIDGAVQTAVQAARGGGGTVVVNPSASQDVLTEILKNTINIAPTVVKRNGDRIQVLVARDVDFRSVYELRSATGR